MKTFWNRTPKPDWNTYTVSLDRRYTLYRTGLSDPSPLQVWAAPTTRSQVVATFDVNAGTPISSVVLRMRWRDDVALNSVWTDSEGQIWIPSEIAEVGRRKFLDVAVTHYEDAPITITPTLPVVTGYIPQTGYTAVKDGTPVQNWVIASIRSITPSLATFKLTNDGAAGSIPANLKVKIGNAGDALDLNIGIPAFQFFLSDVSYAFTSHLTIIPAGQKVFRLQGTGIGESLLVGGFIHVLSTTELQ